MCVLNVCNKWISKPIYESERTPFWRQRRWWIASISHCVRAGLLESFREFQNSRDPNRKRRVRRSDTPSDSPIRLSYRRPTSWALLHNVIFILLLVLLSSTIRKTESVSLCRTAFHPSSVLYVLRFSIYKSFYRELLLRDPVERLSEGFFEKRQREYSEDPLNDSLRANVSGKPAKSATRPQDQPCN